MNSEQLQEAFEQAKAAGDYENAYKIEQQLKGAPVDFSFKKMVSNIPGSAMELGKDIVNTVLHPIDTAQAIGNVAQSSMNKAGRNVAEMVQGVEMEPDMPGRSEATANAVGGAIKDRYGSVDAIKNTVMNDPVGALTDVSAAGMATKIPAVAKAARYLDPINAAARTGQSALKVIPKDYAAKLYDSAAKFSNRPTFDRNTAIRVALEEGILPTKGGVKKIQGRINILDSMLDDLIAEAGKAGHKIPVSTIERYIGELRKTKGGLRLGRGKDLKKIDGILEQWHKDLRELGNGTKITHVSPEFIQKFKQSAYGDVSWNKRRPGAKASQVTEDTYKTMARGAKDAISEAIPEASEINKLLGELLELQPELISAAGRLDKRNLFSLDTSVKVGAGAATGAAADAAGIGAGLGMAISLLGNPRVKPRIALALKRLRDGDVKWIDQNIGDPAVRAALALAGRAEQFVGAPSDDAE